MYRKRVIIPWCICSCECRGWDIWWSATCKLEAQERHWSSSPIQRPDNQPSLWYESQFKSEGSRVEHRCPKAEEDGWLTSNRQQILPSLDFDAIHSFNKLDDAPCIGKGWSTLLSLSIWMLISSENTLTETPINNVLLATWTQANWHIKPTLIGGDPGNWRNEDIREKSQQAGGILIGWLQWKTDALSCPDPLRDYACHFSIQ